MSRSSLHRLLLRPALLATGALAALPAAAQFYGGYPPPYVYNAPPPSSAYGDRGYSDARRVSPASIVDRLEDQGYEDVGRPRFTGTLYLVEATAPGGMRVRVAIDAVRGMILNRTALGYRGGGRNEEDDDDRDSFPQRRYGGRPAQPDSDEMPAAPLRGRLDSPGGEYRERREASRPPPERELPAPAEPRLAPSPEAVTRDFESRESLRSAPRSGAAASPGRPYGVNPDAIPKRKPNQQARRSTSPNPEVETQPLPGSGAPTIPGTSRGTGPAPAKTTAQAKPGPDRPVRIIEGVTPLNGNGSGRTQLDNLPAPPPAPSPGSGE